MSTVNGMVVLLSRLRAMSMPSAVCTICSTDKSIAHGRLNDVKQHIAAIKHVSFVYHILPYSGALSPFFKLCRLGLASVQYV